VWPLGPVALGQDTMEGWWQGDREEREEQSLSQQ
jgi:hypothetical protein